jgi:hypothetical protein
MNRNEEKADLAVTAAFDAVGMMVLGVPPVATGATIAKQRINRVLQRRADNLREVFFEEMGKGSRDPRDVMIGDEGVAILYRYMQAGLEGRARLNLRLMAKVIVGHVPDSSMYASEFSLYADRLVSLTRDEVVFLATLLRLTRNGVRTEKNEKPGEYYELEQSVAIKLRQILSNNEMFGTLESVNSCELAIQRTGFLRLVTTLSSGGVIYGPSPYLLRLTELADFEDALRAEGIEIPQSQ